MLVEAAVRAVAEMTGLSAVAAPFLGWYEWIPERRDDPDPHRVVMCFELVVLDDREPVRSPELAEACWMPVWDVSELPLADGLAELLAEHGVIDTLA